MVDKLLEFENNLKILDYKFGYGDYLIWPFIRYSILSRYIFKSINYISVTSSGNNFSRGVNVIIENIKDKFFNSSEYNVIEKKNIVFFYDSVSNIKFDNGEYFNRLFDYYSMAYPDDTIMIESSGIVKQYGPRVFKRVYKYQNQLDIIKIKSRLSSISKKDKKMIENFLEYFRNEFPIKVNNEDLDFVRMILYRIAQRLKPIERMYSVFLKKTNPKIIFVEDALYGSEKAILLKLANDMGIITAEFQHGMIYMNHIAYNYSKSICNDENYKRYTPDYFLTMGKYWSDNCNVPSKKIVIGSPHLYNNVKRYAVKKINEMESSSVNKTKILIIGADRHNDYIKFAKDLAQRTNDDIDIIIKAHPMYMNQKNLYQEINNDNRIKMIYEGNIYDFISNADIIVGDCSTALYEAIGFGKKVFIIENESSKFATPIDLGTWITDAESLIKLVKDFNHDREEDIKNHFWEPNWEKNYREFLLKVGAL